MVTPNQTEGRVCVPLSLFGYPLDCNKQKPKIGKNVSDTRLPSVGVNGPEAQQIVQQAVQQAAHLAAQQV